MRRDILLYVCAIFAFAVSCDHELDEQTSNSESTQLIVIDPMIQSRAADDSFDVGDKIALTVVMDDEQLYAINQEMSYDGNQFCGDTEWYSDESAQCTFIAYHPYIAGESLPTSFSVQADQSTAEGYSVSDLMVAHKSEVVRSTSTLMTFTHLLSQMVATIDNRSGKTIKSISIAGTKPTAVINLDDKSVEVQSTSQSIEITTRAWSDGGYRMIFIPQNAALTFTVTFEDGSTISSEKSTQEYLAGELYTASITLLEQGITITISSGVEQWGEGDDIEIVDKVSFEEFDNYFIYDEQLYNIKTFSNGLTVMVDNMRYIPKGMSPSSDPSDASGLWYTYSLAADPADPTADYIATALTDDESVAKYGYLYNYATAFGADVTGDNYDQFEGVQGICPEGWHIPTQAELHSLCGDGYGASDDSSAPFYDSTVGYGSIQKANELGFNHNYAGSIANDRYTTTYVASDYTDSDSQESIIGKNSLTYYMSSTAQTYWPNTDKACYYALYTSHATAYTAKGCISVMLSYEPYGVSLRCVKNK